MGREALYDPFWALHAAAELGCDPDFSNWHSNMDGGCKSAAVYKSRTIRARRHTSIGSGIIDKANLEAAMRISRTMKQGLMRCSAVAR
jgi:hypothetical protein